jgi:hypothetical protein
MAAVVCRNVLTFDPNDTILRIPTKSPGYNGMMSPGIPE